MIKGLFTLILLITNIFLFSQTQKEIDLYKSKFFLYPNIGTDSALFYVNKIFTSKNNNDLAFAYTAKRHLLTITGKINDEKNYLSKLKFHLKKIKENKTNYLELSQVYNILGSTELINQKYNDALDYFIKAEFFAENNNDTKQVIKVKGNIARIKLELKQTDEAITDIKKVLALLDKNKEWYEKENFDIVYNNNLLNLGYSYTNKFISTKKKEYFDNALINFDQILKSSKNKALIADVYLKMGTLYAHHKKDAISSNYYRKSLKIFDSLQIMDKALNVKYNLALNEYRLNNLQRSKKYFLQLSKYYQNDTIKNIDYIISQDYLSKIYLKEKNIDSSEYYSNLFINLYDKNGEKEKENIKFLYKELNERDLKTKISEIKKQNAYSLNKRMLIIIVFGVFIIFIIFFSVLQFRKKKVLEKQLIELINRVKNDKYVELPNEQETKNFSTISSEKEAEIIQKLLELEKKQYYLKSEFNQAFAAKKLSTNTAYLSQAINNYMKKTFSEYSNELRINFILKELSENKKIRGYTTQALAEMIGYKNGNSFARSFKEKTGVTPFQYIDKLNKE
jgi:AraC-like DNA-binding protein/tetratricopeptide (TPR) repeat protein